MSERAVLACMSTGNTGKVMGLSKDEAPSGGFGLTLIIQYLRRPGPMSCGQWK